MTVKKTDRGSLYGKTGSLANEEGKYAMGWFVGYVESKGKVYGFACNVQGKDLMGKDARDLAQGILEAGGML